MIRRALNYQQRLTGEPLLPTIKRYFIFISGGFLGWLVLISLHTYLRNTYGINPAYSYGVGIVLADVFTFVYHRFVTFRIKTRWQMRFIQFTVLVVSLSFVNWALFSLGRVVLDLPIPDFIMSFVITGFISVVNFGINRIFIFRHH